LDHVLLLVIILKITVAENAGVENAGADSKGGHVKEMDFLYIQFFSATTPTLRVC